MKKKVKINLKNKQSYTDDNVDNVDIEQEAVLHKKRGKYYLLYRDFSEGLDGVRTVIKVDPEENMVNLQRSKPVQMRQTFRQGKRIDGVYKTAAGNFKIETGTESLYLEMGMKKGTIELKYKIYINGDLLTVNNLKIYYKEIDDIGE